MIIKIKEWIWDNWQDDEMEIPDSAKVYFSPYSDSPIPIKGSNKYTGTYIICSKEPWDEAFELYNLYCDVLEECILDTETLPIEQCPISGYILHENRDLLSDEDFKYCFSPDFDEDMRSFILDKTLVGISKILGIEKEGLKILTVVFKEVNTGEPVYIIKEGLYSFNGLWNEEVCDAEELFIEKFNLIVSKLNEDFQCNNVRH